MPGSIRAPEEYSTNPSTIKARRRKMSLNGAKKVEDAARTADYKAMIYARKVVQAKQEYKAASDSEKSAMLEKAMRDTMAKRRARGQDTMSKMAAFDAGMYQHRSSTTGPQTRVPISAFLEDNGFVPSRGGRNSKGGNGGGDDDGSPVTPVSFGSAPEADMTGVGNAFARANGLSSFAGHDGSAPVNSYSPNNRLVKTPAQPRRSPNLFMNHSPLSARPETNIKLSATPAPFTRTANMTPEPMMLSIEGPDASSNDGDTVSMLRMEVGHLRTICQNVLQVNHNLRDSDFGNVRAEVAIEKNRVSELDRRVGQLEGVGHALQNTSMTTVVERVGELERLVEELRNKVGCGVDGEVAKMREVMGCMRAALERVGGFL
ncbi:hypothetical protein VM1G_04792 [Cytospora mali]|uniref:Uncharacterized protein n=1 Tax=Cytospora mali TaxID=578113 RepID=A0A194W126_CYTMA|nr:hypothetical protein VM1G_04792 [Valsa mali]